MIIFWQKFKNNVKNKFMRDKCKINDLKNLIKATINFNNQLYKRIIKQKYSKRHSKKIKNYINNQIYENKTNLTRNNRGYNHSKTIFMKLNSMMFRKFRQKNKKKCVLFMWQKKSFCKKLQIKKRCLMTIQCYAEKKWKKYRLRNNQNFINWFWKWRISQNPQIIKFSKCFKWKKKQNSNSTTAQINATINDFNIDKFMF